MSIATRVEEIENHLVDDWNAVAGVGGDTSLDKNIENIARALDNVYDELPKVSGEGTSVTLNNTKKGRISSVLKGNTSQDTTNGKNLLNLKDTLNATHNGISYTYNSDGSFSFSGTATTNASHVNADTNISLANGTYTFSIQSALTVNLRLQIYFTDNTSVTKTISAGSTSITFDISNEVSKFYVGLMNLTSGTSYSGTVYAMLESGSTATDFEPFTYGISPNPNYPQDIDVVSGDNEIKVCGKNLFDNTLTLSFTPTSTNWYSLDGVANFYSATNVPKSNCYFDFKAGVTYTLSVNSITNMPYISLCDLQGSNILNPFNTSATYTPSEDIRGWFRTRPTNTDTLTSAILQIEYGSTATDFEPYQSQKLLISLNENNLYRNVNTIINNRLNTTGENYSERGYFISDYIEVEENQNYIVNYIPTAYTRVCFYNSNKGFINKNDNSSTFTTPTNTKYIRLCNTINNINKIQLEKGNTLTTGIELCKIGDYQDKLIRSSGKNLKDFTSITYSAQNSATVTRNNGVYTVTGGTGRWGSCRFGITATNLQPNTTYTFSALVVSTTATNGSCVIVYGGANTTGNVIAGSLAKAGERTFITFTTPAQLDSGTKDIGLVNYEENATATFTDIMLEIGSTMHDYEPYGYGKWYKYGMVNKKILVGTEYWGSDSGVFYTWDITDYARSSNKPYVNYYKGYLNASGSSSAYQKGNNSACFNNSTSNSRFYIRNDVVTTTNDFKTWLSTHNTILYYILLAPTITEITNTYLINQLNDYYNALSYQNQTNISQENADLPFVINAEALLDTNTYINQLEEQIEVLS